MTSTNLLGAMRHRQPKSTGRPGAAGACPHHFITMAEREVEAGCEAPTQKTKRTKCFTMVNRALEASSTGCCNQRRTPRARTCPLLPRHVLRFTPALAGAAELFVQVCVLHSAEAFAMVPRIHQVSAPAQSLCLGSACHQCLTAQQHKLVVPDRRITPAEGTTTPTHLYASKDSDDDLDCDNMYREDDDSDDDDEDEVEIQPYGNRSLSWTKRYRRLNPYEKCRARVLRFGHRSKEDWDEAAASGQLGQCKYDTGRALHCACVGFKLVSVWSSNATNPISSSFLAAGKCYTHKLTPHTHTH